MPLQIDEVTLPSGAKTMRTVASGFLTVEDAQKYVDAFATNGPYHGRPNCGVIAPGCEIPAESRKVLGGIKPDSWSVAATVVPNMALRMIATFMVKIIGHNNIKIFGDEKEAMAWLDVTIPKVTKQ